MDQAFDANLDDEKLAADLRDAFMSELGEPMDVTVGGPHFGGSSGRSTAALRDGWTPRGARLGDFEIVDEVGRGGMGIVYRARQLSLNREVALKVLPGYARRGRTAVQRFRTEAQAAARLHHTNIVPIYAQGEESGRFFYAMELIDGASLDSAIRTRSRVLSPSNTRLAQVSDLRSSITSRALNVTAPSATEEPPADDPPSYLVRGLRDLGRTREDYQRIARMFADVAEGLAHAHASGVVHRDIKPQNLLVDRDLRLHITDFGLARLADAPTITVPGEVMGTPAYLSPEQIEAHVDGVDFRTDIYSLGVTLYELLTLRRPFEGETREQILTGIRTCEPASPRRFDGQIPKDLETICLKAMEKEPARRFSSAADLADELRRFAEGRPIRSRPLGPVGRMLKWCRRHRAATTAIALAAIAMILATGLALSVQESKRARAVAAERARHERAATLIAEVRQRVVYLDYRRTDHIAELLSEAESLGGAEEDLAKLRGIVAFGENNLPAAEKNLQAAIALENDDAEARYLLARVYERLQRQDLSAAELAAAENIGARTASEWFFRGLALHWNDTDEAIRSYEQARRERLTEGDVYLQATLQLARARNQRMYSQRSLDDFSTVTEALTQLIDYQVYGSYPYYLMSIAHRLAGEIYDGSNGTRDDAMVREHLEKALEYARAGEALEPEKPMPHSAEAFALETMNRWEEAVRAHGDSIRVSTGDREGYCEAHHYRWRLYFWLGDYDAALSDIVIQRSCPLPSPDFLYSRAYPALVYAAKGNLERARLEANAIVTDHPGSAIAVVWAASWLRLLGDSPGADALLAQHSRAVDFSAELTGSQTAEWVEILYRFVQSGDNAAAVAEYIEKADKSWPLKGEFDFHAGIRALAAGDIDAAKAALERSYRSFDSEQRYTYNAKLLLEMLRQDSAWPPWIIARGLDSAPANRVEE
jgi:serine/threonine protein kinase/tetratricopeptide (TPR) repeat protein